MLFAHFYGKAAKSVSEPAGENAFPDWPMEEHRTKKGIVDMYRMVYGLPAAQWIAPQLGFPAPPPSLIQPARQLDMFQSNDGSYHPPAE